MTTNKERIRSITKYLYPNILGHRYYIPSKEMGIQIDPQHCIRFKTRKDAIRWIYENYPEY